MQYIEDTTGNNAALHFLRTKDGKEIDFLICIEEKPTHLIEVKYSRDEPSPHFRHFAKAFPNAKQIQLVKDLKREKTYPDGLEIRSLIPWLSHLDLQPEV